MITIKKTWSFIKNYWYIPLVMAVSSIGYLLTKSRKIPTDEILKASKKTHEVEKAAIEHAAEQKVKAKQLVEEEYQSAVRSINKIHELQNQNDRDWETFSISSVGIFLFFVSKYPIDDTIITKGMYQ